MAIEKLDIEPTTLITEDNLSEYKDPYQRSGEATAVRLLMRYGKHLLLVHEPGGNASVRMLDGATNIWRDDWGTFGRMVSEQGVLWMADLGKALLDKDVKLSNSEVKGVAEYVRLMGSPGGWRQARDSIAAAAVKLGLELRKEIGITECKIEELDQNLTYLGCANGIVSLSTGELVSEQEGRSALLTQQISTAYKPDAVHPDVDKLFVHQDEGIRDYLLAAIGNALRMRVHNRAYAIQTPTGAGKTTLMTAIFSLLDGVVGEFQADAIKQTDGNRRAGLEPEKKPFADYRIVYTDELQGVRIDTGRAKQLWGFGNVTLREPYQPKAITRRLIAHCFLLSNSLPQFRLSDAAVVRRLRIIPMQPIPESDREEGFADRMQEQSQREALLALLVQAARDNPTQPKDPREVMDAMEAARTNEIGQVGAWLEEHVVRDRNGFLGSRDVWDRLRMELGGAAWEQMDRVDGMTHRRVISLLGDLFDYPVLVRQTDKGKTRRGWAGIRLRTSEDDVLVTCAMCMSEVPVVEIVGKRCADKSACSDRAIARMQDAISE